MKKAYILIELDNGEVIRFANPADGSNYYYFTGDTGDTYADQDSEAGYVKFDYEFLLQGNIDDNGYLYFYGTTSVLEKGTDEKYHVSVKGTSVVKVTVVVESEDGWDELLIERGLDTRK